MTTVLVTGANRGIGLELCRQYAEEGADVIAACRKPSPELEALGVQIEAGVDVTDQEALDRLAAAVKDHHLDVLFLNAGILQHRSKVDALDLESIRRQLEVNALGPLRATSALLGSLGEGSKVAIVTSRMGSIEDNTSGGAYGYRMSKAAVNMAGRSLAHDLKDRGIAVVLLHPGFVQTEMTGGRGNIDAAEAARGLRARVSDLELETTGTFWHQSGERLPW